MIGRLRLGGFGHDRFALQGEPKRWNKRLDLLESGEWGPIWPVA
jgi:hypothetical protein